MAGLDDWGFTEPPMAGDEVAMVLASLERQRSTFAWKCGGLDEAGLRVTVGVSAITLGGLLKHLAHCEEGTFARKFLGRPWGPPWDAVDWDADPDWEWHSCAEDSAEELYALWRDAVERSRATVAEAMAGEGLETLSTADWKGWETPNLRRLVVDLIEEYARHVGHADLIRETVDGLTGEDPPQV